MPEHSGYENRGNGDHRSRIGDLRDDWDTTAEKLYERHNLEFNLIRDPDLEDSDFDEEDLDYDDEFEDQDDEFIDEDEDFEDDDEDFEDDEDLEEEDDSDYYTH